MILIFTGLLAGIIHVLSGPDHLAAIVPFSVNGRKSTWKIGFKWGLGHTGGVFVIALLALLFRELIPTELISSLSEKLVGVVLIAIGLWGFRLVLSKKIHTHQHTHDGYSHVHIHLHNTKIAHEKSGAHLHTHAAFGIGIIHGLAGSSHLLGVLPALALPTRTEATVYLLFFGIGTILAMIIFSTLLGIIATKISSFSTNFYKTMSISFNLIAICVGGIWLFLP